MLNIPVKEQEAKYNEVGDGRNNGTRRKLVMSKEHEEKRIIIIIPYTLTLVYASLTSVLD